MEKQNSEPTLPYVELLVEGFPGVYAVEGKSEKGFRLTYDFNQLCEAEQATGFNLLAPLKNLPAMSAGQMRGILLGLLKTAHPKTNLQEAGMLLSKDGRAVIDAIYKALDAESGEDALFLKLSRVAVERPMELVALMSRLKLPEPEVEAAPVEPSANA